MIFVFKYKQVNYDEFSNHYAEDAKTGWMGRKVLVLPKAMLSFFVLTTYHLGLALIDGLPKLKDGDQPFYNLWTNIPLINS